MDKGYVNTEKSQIAFIGVIFTSTYHTKQLNPWPNSSASCVVNYSWLSACQGDMEPFKDHPSTHGCLTSLRNKSSLGKLQCQYLTELLVNVYRYSLMEKSVSRCCVHGRQILSNPVMFLEGFPEDSAIAILFMLTVCNLPTGTCLLIFL